MTQNLLWDCDRFNPDFLGPGKISYLRKEYPTEEGKENRVLGEIAICCREIAETPVLPSAPPLISQERARTVVSFFSRPLPTPDFLPAC